MRSDLYLKHDLYALQNDEKFRWFCQQIPGYAYAVFFEVACMLTKNGGNPTRIDRLVNDLSDSTHIKKAMIRKCIDLACSEEYHLFVKTDKNEIYSKRVQRDVAEGKRISEARRNAVSSRYAGSNEEQDENKGDSNEEQLNNNSTTTNARVYQDQNQEQEQEQEQDNSAPALSPVTPSAPRSVFIVPTVSEVAAYCQERRNDVDPQRFYDFYQSKGWLVGKTRMKDWQACIRTWEKTGNSRPSSGSTGTRRFQSSNPIDDVKIEEF
ncbi:MAG: hypothetical protein WCR70_03775 [Sphaerochaetaceae bacterium]